MKVNNCKICDSKIFIYKKDKEQNKKICSKKCEIEHIKELKGKEKIK